jgi:hypothetical protein
LPFIAIVATSNFVTVMDLFIAALPLLFVSVIFGVLGRLSA